MFTVVTGRRKSRIFTPRVVAISAAAHLLVLIAFVSAAAKAPPPSPPVSVIELGGPPETKPQPPAPKPVQPQPQKPVGQTLVVHTPETTPTEIPHVDPTEPPTHPEDFSGIGVPGDSISHSPPAPQPTPGTGEHPTLPRDWREDVSTPDEVDVLPELASPRDAARMLERVYPPMLRDAGVTGHTTVQLIIDKDGNVEPGSISVQESTNDAFRDAAIRAAEKFRFRPAKLHGQPVSVIISLPIDWRIQTN